MGKSSIDGEVKEVSGKLVNVRLADLHYQYIPVVTPAEIWENDMALPTSPHVEMLRMLVDGQPATGTRYWSERQRRRLLGMSQWTDDHIRHHIKVRRGILQSLKKHGFKPDLYKDRPVKILMEPFWKTRFGGTPEWVKGMEIWDGGGRCAAAFVLGWETIPAVMVRDRAPGSGDKGGFAAKLSRVPPVWEETAIRGGRVV